MSVFFGNEVSVSNKISIYILLHAKGNQKPKQIWLNKYDYQQLLKELKAIQRIDCDHESLEVPETKANAGFPVVLFNETEVCYSALAQPLPTGLTDMKDWKNMPIPEAGGK